MNTLSGIRCGCKDRKPALLPVPRTQNPSGPSGTTPRLPRPRVRRGTCEAGFSEAHVSCPTLEVRLVVILEEPPRVQQRTGVAPAPLPGRETKPLEFPPWQERLCHAKEVTVTRPSAASRWTPVTGRCDHRVGTLSCQTAGKRQKLETECNHGGSDPQPSQVTEPQ